MPEDKPAKVIWSLAYSGLGTTIGGAGNSGGWSNTGTTPNQLTNLDLRFVDDLALYVFVGSIVTAPSLTVKVDGYDDLGNLIPNLASTTAITAAGAATPVYVGKHGGAAGNFVVLPAWGRVSWTCTGGSVNGAEIVLWGR
jgi:hypothetical protein